jgi:glutathionylspermidine synthase
MALQTAVDAYHALLTDELGQETQAHLNTQLQARGLTFGERLLINVLRPRFLALEQYRFLQQRVHILLSAFSKVYERAMQDAQFRRQFALFDWEEQLIASDPGFREASPLSRLDAFFVHERGGLRFTEYNAETPAGASYNDILAEATLGLPVMREFMKQYSVYALPSRHNVMHALLNSWRQFTGQSQRKPRIAILDWAEVPTYSEFVLTRDYLHEQGLECVIVDPRHVEYRNGKLEADGVALDLVYKRVLLNELVERGGLEHPVVRAVRDRAVCMVNPFRCKLLHKKLSLAMLSDEHNHDMFSADEVECIQQHIPWTRRVTEMRTEFHGESVDLLPFVAGHRDRFVLKPNDEYGGKGIVLGWEVSDEQWQTSMREALREPFIVQERIQLPIEPYPVLVEGKVRIEDRIEDTAPFIFYGQYMDGLMSRLSTESLVNVTAGGGSSVATFIVAPR